LAGFALEGGRPETALDLGTGCGIIAALLAAQGVDTMGLDVRPEWLPFWAETLKGSFTKGTLSLQLHDVANGWPHTVDLVTANPPFFPAAHGPGSPNPWKRAARTEADGGLSAFLSTGAQALSAEGRLCVVLPIGRAEEATICVRTLGLHLSRQVKVGRKRVLLEWSSVRGVTEESATLETAARARGWYQLATESPTS